MSNTIRLKEIFALLPDHELVTVRVHSKTRGYYDAFTRLVYEGIPYDYSFAIVEKIEARATECLEITVKENRIIIDEN